MSLTVSKNVDGSVQIHITGPFNLSLHKSLRKIYRDTSAETVFYLDFSQVTHMDSAGLSMLLLLHKHVLKQKSNIYISNCPPLVYQVIEIAQVSEMFVFN